ncbi:MAG: thioredoxin [Myxococcales bacterium]|nr:thioredoxin [Myxococcales bacterium]
MAGQNVHQFTDTNFATEVEKSDSLVLVDFWAVWCGPCKMIAPVVQDLATEYSGKLKVGKLDVDTNGLTAARYGITSIPQLILYKNGKEVDRMVGAAPKPRIKAFVDRHL